LNTILPEAAAAQREAGEGAGPRPVGRVLLLQFRRPWKPGRGLPRFDPVLGVLSAVLRQQGHQTNFLRIEQLDADRLRERINEFRPDFLYADIGLPAADLARGVLGHADARYGLHGVAGGLYAMLHPDVALSLPGVQAVVVGEPDQALPAYLRSHLLGEPVQLVPGLWYRDEHGTVRTGLPTLTADLDSLPPADRAVFANGRPEPITCPSVSIGRGCPLRCAYCPNEGVAELYAGQDDYVRRRDPETICDEIDALCLAHPQTERIRFPDHHFALDEAWLEEFAAVYVERCGVPFSCHLRAQYVSERVVDLLAQAGCVEAEIEVVSSSDFVRNEILGMGVTDEQIEQAFARLRAGGIATRAVSFVGTPYATEVSQAALLDLDSRLQPDVHEVCVFHPLPGTRAHDLCRELGWLSNRGEDSYTRQRSVLDMPTLPAGRIDRLYRKLERTLAARRAKGFRQRLRHMLAAAGDRVGSWIGRA